MFPCLEFALSLAYWRLDDEVERGENPRLVTSTLEQRNQPAQPVGRLAVVVVFVGESKLNWVMLIHKRFHQLQRPRPSTHEQHSMTYFVSCLLPQCLSGPLKGDQARRTDRNGHRISKLQQSRLVTLVYTTLNYGIMKPLICILFQKKFSRLHATY